MKKQSKIWNIVTDSSCDLVKLENLPQHIKYTSVPFVLTIDDRDYIDDVHLDTSTLLHDMNTSQATSHSGCPCPNSWLWHYEEADNIFCITISEKLSGSYNSALSAKNIAQQQNPHQQITILDSQSTGPACVLLVQKLCYLLQDNNSNYNTIQKQMETYRNSLHTIFALSSFDNLVKNGRLNRITGILAKKLHFWGVGIGEDGNIKFMKKVRGKNHVLSTIIEDMETNDFSHGDVVISHCHNLSLAQELYQMIREKWHDSRISILPTRGLNSYYAEDGGIIVSYGNCQ